MTLLLPVGVRVDAAAGDSADVTTVVVREFENDFVLAFLALLYLPGKALPAGRGSRREADAMLRVHMVADDGEPLTMLVPVTADMRLDREAPEPWLFRGRWDGSTYYGEVRLEAEGVTLHWS